MDREVRGDATELITASAATGGWVLAFGITATAKETGSPIPTRPASA